MAASTIHSQNIVSSLLEKILNEPSFALIEHEGNDHIDLLTGTSVAVRELGNIPLDGREVVSMVPFRQVKERGFDAVDDDVPILCLLVDQKIRVSREELVCSLPEGSPEVEDMGFNLSDEEYATVARKVIQDEIGRGEGANFVIRRDYAARTDVPMREAVLAWFRKLLLQEKGAYWTYAFVTPEISAVGASPERHVSSVEGTVLMNPISGTYRHGAHQPTEKELLNFLKDRKESEELVMVVDEELKMMSAVCPDGGVMRGPFLKPMSKLTHTEYLLEGKTTLDPREVLRLTMFAPTVTGSPMENACKVIARHEGTGRGYYSGVLAHFTPRKDNQGYDLDAPILIRTAFINRQGDITVTAGATLVRHSDPLSEAAETRAKASGVLSAIGLMGNVLDEKKNSDEEKKMKDLVSMRLESLAEIPSIREALMDRNRHLAPFWRERQEIQNGRSENKDNQSLKLGSTFKESKKAIVIDCEDDFTAMLAHQLRRLGLDVSIRSWKQQIEDSEADLVVFGPGPGDPTDLDDPRVRRVRDLIERRVNKDLPTIAVCLSHQMLSDLAGLNIVKLPSPRQGTPLDVTIDIRQKAKTGRKEEIEPVRIGYYNTFTAQGITGHKTSRWDLEINSELDTDFVHALVSPKIVSVQGHLESVLSFDGFSTLSRLVDHVLSE